MADENAEGAVVDETLDSSQVTEGQDLEEEEREPGGDSPEQIRARKEYRLRKKTEAALQVEREKGIALEARVNTLQEVARREAPPPAVERRLTSTEAWQKVDAGEWTREGATEYIADNRYAENRNKERTEEKAVKEIVEPIEKAKREALEYVSLFPSLRDKTHPKWGEIESEVKYLLTEGGIKHINQAERLALRKVLGPIDQIREKQRVSGMRPSGDSHVETRGGGGGNLIPNKKDSFSDIPQYTKDLWERTRTPEKDRETEAKFFRENRNKRKT